MRRICAVTRLVGAVLAVSLLVSGVLAQTTPTQTTTPTEDLPLATLQTRAEAGEAAAQTALGRRYHDGAGVMQNFAQAAAWYARAAGAGDAEAQNLLGRYYHTGSGVGADRATALRWLRAAAAQGAPQHLHDLATVLEEAAEDPDALAEAVTLYARAAEAGHRESAVSLGVMYQNGLGVAQDYDRARALYEGPAAAGHARAQNNLGLLYVRGNGVLQDYDRAAALFAAAADQGLAPALTNLGVMYENGFGVPQDDARAAELYRQGGAGISRAQAGFVYDPRLAPPPSDPAAIDALRAAARAGDPVAEFQMAWLLVHLAAPGPGDWREAAALLSRAAVKGHAASMVNLGLLYVQGRGLPQDYVLAQMWLTLAGSVVPEVTAALSAEVQNRMTPAQINEAQAMAVMRRAAARTAGPESAASGTAKSGSDSQP